VQKENARIHDQLRTNVDQFDNKITHVLLIEWRYAKQKERIHNNVSPAIEDDGFFHSLTLL
jgi:hypothetical protein